jgi:hypothetical protein
MPDAEDAPSSAGEIAINLTFDEALVLDGFLSRAEPTRGDCFTIEHQAELRVLWNIGAILESSLPIVNNPDYERLLASARERVRDQS